MKTFTVILLVAALQVLVAHQGQSSSLLGDDVDHSIAHKHMMEDFAELVDLQEDPAAAKWGKPKPGQILSRCSLYKYGCCQDGKTRADGPDRRNCGKKLCADNQVGACIKKKLTNSLVCTDNSLDANQCAFQCKKCQYPASKLKLCLREDHIFGCCWNGVPALGPNSEGCPPCRDNYPHTCNQFKSVSGGCNGSGSYGIRTFLEKYCPSSCGVCRYHYTK